MASTAIQRAWGIGLLVSTLLGACKPTEGNLPPSGQGTTPHSVVDVPAQQRDNAPIPEHSSPRRVSSGSTYVLDNFPDFRGFVSVDSNGNSIYDKYESREFRSFSRKLGMPAIDSLALPGYDVIYLAPRRIAPKEPVFLQFVAKKAPPDLSLALLEPRGHVVKGATSRVGDIIGYPCLYIDLEPLLAPGAYVIRLAAQSDTLYAPIQVVADK